jgi:hypothetical protein
MSEQKQNSAANFHEFFEITKIFATTYTVKTAYNVTARNRTFSVQVRFHLIQVLEVWYFGAAKCFASRLVPVVPRFH